MRHVMTTLTLASLVGAALAGPASAQMRPSAPKPGGVVKTTAAVAGPTGSDEYRPTNVFGVHRAQTLMSGATVVGIDGGNLAFNYGINPDLELGVLAGLDLNRIGGSFDTDLNLGAGVKYRFSNAENLGIAGMVGLGIAKPDGANTMQTSIFASLPISFWINKRGGFHVVPGINMGPDPANPTQTATTFGTGLAYEMELNPTWRLMIADRISFANNQVQNSYQGGLRIGVTPTPPSTSASSTASSTSAAPPLKCARASASKPRSDFRPEKRQPLPFREGLPS